MAYDEPSEDERWMYGQVGAILPIPAARRELSLGGAPALDDELDDLEEALLAAFEAQEAAEPAEEEEAPDAPAPSMALDALAIEQRGERVAVDSEVPEASSAASDGDSDAGSSVGHRPGVGEPAWVTEALALPEWKTRLPYEAWRARSRVQCNMETIRDYSRRLIELAWGEAAPDGQGREGKKFPSSYKAITTFSNRTNKRIKEETKKTERAGLLHPVTPERTWSLDRPMRMNLPEWKRLPGKHERSPEITEIITGLRFGSVAFGESACLDRWFSAVPGEDTCCLSIDLHGDAADRFLAGEKGEVGAALHRGLRRRLERDMGDLAMGAFWIRPHGSPRDHVRLFLVIRASCMKAARDVEWVDRGMRFHNSLVRHGVRISPDGVPLAMHEDDIEAYYGVPVEEIIHGREVSPGVIAYLSDADLQEYTPEAGFLSQEEIAALAAKSHAKWSNYAARHGLAKWVTAEFVQEIVDCLVLSPKHVRERQRLREAFHSNKFKNRPKAAKAAKVRLQQLELMELAPNGIQIYRCSPAQLAALAVRDGEVLGDSFDSRHKGPRGAKPLYEELRKLWRAPSWSLSSRRASAPRLPRPLTSSRAAI